MLMRQRRSLEQVSCPRCPTSHSSTVVALVESRRGFANLSITVMVSFWKPLTFVQTFTPCYIATPARTTRDTALACLLHSCSDGATSLAHCVTASLV